MEGSACAPRRRVLFVHGYDPRGPAPYHALMADEEAPGAFVVGRRAGSCWSLSVDWPQGRAESLFEVLQWDDVVRSLWVRGAPARWLSWRFLPAYLRSGVLAEAGRCNRPLFFALIIPALVGILFAVSLLLATAATVGLAATLIGALGGDPRLGLCGIALILAGPGLWRAVRARIDLDWLSQCFDVLVRFRAMPEARETKLDAMAERIVSVARDAPSEPLIVVGHSIGTVMAVAAVSRALAMDPLLGRRVSLVTLGQCLAIYARLGGDARWARDLEALVRSDVAWTDVTSPADAASSGRWGPLRFSAQDAHGGRVRAISPRFHEALRPDRLHRLRRDPYAFHFQYLRLSDRAEIYDIRRLIVGPPDPI